MSHTSTGTLSATELTRIKRGAKRAVSDRQNKLDFIDQSLLCFVGFQLDGTGACHSDLSLA